MKELTIEEIVQYAVKIEKESFQFYEEAADRVQDGSLERLLKELAMQEQGHIDSLNGLLTVGKESGDYLSNTINIDRSSFSKIVPTMEITEKYSSLEILEAALERELNTKRNYEMFLGLARLNVQVCDLFRTLAELEATHIALITEKINMLKE